MSIFQRAILTHGGAGSDPQNFDGPKTAAKIGMDLMANGQTALNAVVQAVRYLEDDPRFNAGIGSQIRADNTTIQLDASCMTSIGKFGAVACVEGIQNPVDLALGVLMHSPHFLIVGDGAKAFADENNIPMIPMGDMDRSISLPSSCDTVGAIAFDGTIFAAALSSGGLEKAAIGRVGDVPLPGCGLFCGPSGAVACTGDGESIALKILAKEVYGWLENNISPKKAALKAMGLFDDRVDIGLIILTQTQFALNSRNGMACSHLMEIR
ncbi:isoaspartyl peptidase/L-asparaginase [Desulfobacula phenolica]|uniref:Beta-aspartyl-peptidase (Threonine type) n=1 Tax=Desulfobacula phenolica TaxID=90732 RepID=A0A1H2FFU4_9BACT|nr:isoaspartyl peptidase/L-asparaginase [Desulfobacula phenolica]SDU05838.1 beta-aspartyl-peptidase (threonine type) [Desulfobacula phenolica]